MNFNWVDILLILIVVLSIWSGWQRGFIIGLLDLVRWAGSLLAGLILYKTVSRWLENITDWTEVWNHPVAFVLVVIVTSLIILLVSNALLRRIPKDVHEHPANKSFGILPGLVGGLITTAIVATLLFSMPFSDGLTETSRNSYLANRLAVYTEELETALVPIFDPAIRQTLNRRTTVQPGSTERVELLFKIDNAPSRPELEAQMLELVNQERMANDLDPLEADPEMTEVARRHSGDMFSRGYFSHYTPENKDPFDRMREGDVRFRTAGENLAFAPTVPIAHIGLMNSPGHRANILRPAFGRVGIGILDGGRRGLMVTQKFRD